MLHEAEIRRINNVIVCTRLDVFENLQQELETGCILGFHCPPTKESATTFLRLYEEHTQANMSVHTSRYTTGTFVVYKALAKCHLSVRPCNSKSTVRHMGCPWRITMSVKTWGKQQKSDLHGCGLIVRGSGRHNHLRSAPEALSTRRMGRAAEQRLTELLRLEHTPTSALRTLQLELADRHGADFPRVSTDRSVLPLLFDVYRLKYRLAGMRTPTRRRKFTARLRRLAAQRSDTWVPLSVPVKHATPLAAVVTPVMVGAHRRPHAGHVMLVNSHGPPECRVLLLMSARDGGLPAGAVLSGSAAERDLSTALALLRDALPEDAFGGRGATAGPRYILTGDDAALRAALASTWPESRLLLSTFHLLRNTWSWLHSADSCVKHQDGRELLSAASRLLGACHESELEVELRRLDDRWTSSYPQFVSRMQSLCDRRADWALFHHPSLAELQQHLTETVTSLLSNNILLQMRCQDLVDCHSFLVLQLTGHYRRQLGAMEAGEVKPCGEQPVPPPPPLLLPPVGQDAQVTSQTAVADTEIRDTFLVTCSSEDPPAQCTVNMRLVVCTCAEHVRTGFCQHPRRIRLRQWMGLPSGGEAESGSLQKSKVTMSPAKSGLTATSPVLAAEGSSVVTRSHNQLDRGRLIAMTKYVKIVPRPVCVAKVDGTALTAAAPVPGPTTPSRGSLLTLIPVPAAAVVRSPAAASRGSLLTVIPAEEQQSERSPDQSDAQDSPEPEVPDRSEVGDSPGPEVPDLSDAEGSPEPEVPDRSDAKDAAGPEVPPGVQCGSGQHVWLGAGWEPARSVMVQSVQQCGASVSGQCAPDAVRDSGDQQQAVLAARDTLDQCLARIRADVQGCLLERPDQAGLWHQALTAFSRAWRTAGGSPHQQALLLAAASETDTAHPPAAAVTARQLVVLPASPPAKKRRTRQ